MGLNNFYKRFITSIFGIIFILFSFIYLSEINFLFLGINFNIHPLVLVLIIVFVLEILLQIKRNIHARKILLFIYLFSYLVFFLHVLFIENQVFVIDIFGYLVGKFFGKNKLDFISAISPNKTLEGYIGSIIAGAIWGILILFVMNDVLETNLIKKMLLILGILISSILGDLFVSKVKRVIGVKDFSNFLYGHGGISDRLDSVLPSFAISFWIFFLL